MVNFSDVFHGRKKKATAGLAGNSNCIEALSFSSVQTYTKQRRFFCYIDCVYIYAV